MSTGTKKPPVDPNRRKFYDKLCIVGGPGLSSRPEVQAGDSDGEPVRAPEKGKAKAKPRERTIEDILGEKDDLLFEFYKKDLLPKLKSWANQSQAIVDSEPGDKEILNLASRIIPIAERIPQTVDAADENLKGKLSILPMVEGEFKQLQALAKNRSDRRSAAQKEFQTARTWGDQARAMLVADDRAHIKNLADAVIKAVEAVPAKADGVAVETLEQSVKDLSGAKAKLEELRTAADAGLDARQELGTVKRALEAFAKELPFATETDGYIVAVGKHKAAQNLYISGSSAAADKSVAAAMTKWDKDLDDARKQKDVSALKKDKDEATKARAAVVTRLIKLMALPGADVDPAIAGFLGDARDIVDQAQQALDAGKTKEDFANVRGLLKNFDAVEARAREFSKAAEEKRKADLDAMPNYLKAYEDARRTRDEIAGLPGAGDVLKKADQLLATTMIAQGGKPAVGFAEAVKSLGGMTALKQEAASLSKTFQEKGLPEGVQKAYDAAESDLKDHAKDCPDSLTQWRKARLAGAATKGTTDEPGALNEIAATKEAIAQDIREYGGRRDSIDSLRESLAAALAKLGEVGAPADEIKAIETERDATQADVAARDYPRAGRTLQSLIDRAGELAGELAKAKSDWSGAKQKMEATRATLAKLAAWPPLTVAAGALRDEADEIIELGKSKDYVRTLQRHSDLEKRVKALQDEAGDDVPNEKGLDTLARELPEARELIALAVKNVQDALNTVERYMAKDGVKINNKGSIPHLRLKEVQGQWEKYLAKPNPATFEKDVEKFRVTLIDDLLKQALALASGEGGYDELVEDAKDADKADARTLRTGQVRVMLRSLEVFEDKEHPKLQQEFMALEGGQDPEAPAKMEALEKKLQVQLKKHEEALKKIRAQALKDLSRARGKVESQKGEWGNFKGYYDELMAELGDAEALLASPDPDLVREAAVAINVVYSKATGAGRGSENPSGQKLSQGFSDLQAKQKVLSGQLGGLKERMPDTYADLHARLLDEMTKAARRPAEESLKALADVEAAIAKAVEEVKVAEGLYKQFTDLLPKVRAEVDRVAAKAGQKAMPPEYQAQLDGRFAAAEALAKQEGGPYQALEQLGDIQRELDGLLATPEPGLAIADKNGAAAGEKNEIKVLADQWKAARDEFLKTTLPAAEKAMTEKAGKDADLGQLDDLEGVVNRADTTVKPYLTQGKTTPPLEEARGAFDGAFRTLRDARTTADRLQADPLGTNVNQSGEVKKALELWSGRVSAFQKAAGELQKTFRTVADEGPPEGTAAEKVNELKSKLVQAAADACDQLDAVSRRFDEVGAALNGPVNTLADPTSAEAKRLAAREQILRVVRDAEQDIVSDPVLVALGGTIPKPGKPLRPQIGGLRAGLRRLGIEADSA